jgi:hypothetical protein
VVLGTTVLVTVVFLGDRYMSIEDTAKKIEDTAKVQALGLGVGATVGALTGVATSTNSNYGRGVPKTAMQVGQASGAALRNGAGVSGAAVAGAAVLTAKAAAIGTAVAAAAPIVAGLAAVGTIGYAAYKFLSDDK